MKLLAKFQQLRMFHIFLFLVVFLLLWRIPYYGKYVIDDPFITFRYARNLVQHGQFVFNLNENVLATTTPIYALLIAVIEFLHLPITVSACILNLGFEIAALYVFSLIIAEFNVDYDRVAYLFIGLLTITNRAMSVASNSGLETPLFVLFNFYTLLLIMRRQYKLGAVIGAITTLTRPDGIFVLVVLAAVIMIRERRLPLVEIILALVIGLPWAIIALLTYGSFIPHSVTAKAAISNFMGDSLTTKLITAFYVPLRFFGVFCVPAVIWAFISLFKNTTRRAIATPLIVFLILQLGFLILPSNNGFDWYFAPLITTTYIFVGLGIALLLSYTHMASLIAIACSSFIVAGLIYASAGNYLSVQYIDRTWRDGMFKVIDYLDENVPANSIIQCMSIGILSYYTDFNILDSVGLASPAVTAMAYQSHNPSQLQLKVAASLKPDYIVSYGTENFLNYTPIVQYDMHEGYLIVYKRQT